MEDANKTAATHYSEAKSALSQEDYETAIQKLESLEARFPFGKFAQQAQLDMAYAYYKFDEPESAVASAERFIRLYPRHPRVDYAYYLKGVIKFSQGHSAFDKISDTDPAKRDPESARKAFLYFSQLVNRFPNSKYTPDALERMKYLRNSLARHELYAAEYYIKMEAYVAAANRAKYILENFQKTPYTKEALEIMIDAYKHLKLPQLAADAQRVYDLNFSKTRAN
ncbi:MAG: outer membrane protein assembly factor BamD [Gammaproteobacteria bacterium]|nr:outer membrane protein assembly factor BamD [Gammaproteobacteria bacterium]